MVGDAEGRVDLLELLFWFFLFMNEVLLKVE